MRARRLTRPALRLAALLLAGSTLTLPAQLPLQAQTAQGLQTDPATTGAPATLVADSLRLEGRDRLIAEGNVEALSGSTRLKAARVIYDRTTDRLILEGPVTVVQDDRIVVLADGGDLDATLENGLLRGARMVLDQQVQLAANRIDRVGGRYTQLYKAAATSCRVCDDGTPPLWQIRAKRVVHDQQEKQLYFENAQLRVLDVPVLWFPRLRLPDPTLERATGFLIPELRQTSLLGLGVKMPYFVTLGDHRDLTFTPYLSPKTRTLELRYRQAFRRGDITLNGAVSDDSIGPGGRRSYLFGEGRFFLPRDYQLSFDFEMTSDAAYLLDYDYSEKDRLDSAIAITRTRRDEYSNVSLTSYETLRASESNSTLPTIIGDLTYERRFFPARLGGELRMGLEANSRYRSSDDPVDGIGRDVSRVTADMFWLRNLSLPHGVQASFRGGVSVDGFRTLQDDTFDGDLTEVVPQTSLTLRWPLARQGASGVRHLLEPVAMLGWTGGTRRDLPNDESTRVEFDEGNLLTLSRFPAPDRRERGLMAAYGLQWLRLSPQGLQTTLTLGQVWRDSVDSDFSLSSGLSSQTSDLLVAGQIKTAGGLSLGARTLFDDAVSLSKAEARLMLLRPDFNLSASYVWLGADSEEDRPDTQSEWSIEGGYRLSRHWTGSANLRYDVVADSAAEAGVGLRYRNECVDLRLSLSRRFTSSAIVEPSTDVGLTVSIRGFGVGTADDSYTRTCRNAP
ncbi:LPS-assembly protein LptD [Seohaeicola saemankumensis]|uniref:LPS-assembly protein LptD n=1 Tax=Seohaeicola saemankumensis TaxID=481181 RepID=A0ABW3TFL6_9RHOB